MFNSLRSRLLLSYVAVVFAVLLVITGSLYLVSAVPGVRLLPALQRLSAIGVGSRQQLLETVAGGGQARELDRLLERTAREQNVRILITNVQTNQVIYDTQGNNNAWIGDTISSCLLYTSPSPRDPE